MISSLIKRNLFICILLLFSVLIGVVFHQTFFKKNAFFSDDIILKRFGSQCKIDSVCGQLIGIDCDSAADGSYLYVQRETGVIVSVCGAVGRCPQKGWDCKN